jgi:hypothetical protein
MENMDVDANLTIDFLKDRDIFRASESILVTRLKSPDTFCANTYGICPYPKGNKRLESLAGSFYSDSKSLQPCVHPYSSAQLKIVMRSPISRPLQLRNAGAGGRPEIRKPGGHRQPRAWLPRGGPAGRDQEATVLGRHETAARIPPQRRSAPGRVDSWNVVACVIGACNGGRAEAEEPQVPSLVE